MAFLSDGDEEECNEEEEECGGPAHDLKGRWFGVLHAIATIGTTPCALP